MTAVTSEGKSYLDTLKFTTGQNNKIVNKNYFDWCFIGLIGT